MCFGGTDNRYSTSKYVNTGTRRQISAADMIRRFFPDTSAIFYHITGKKKKNEARRRSRKKKKMRPRMKSPAGGAAGKFFYATWLHSSSKSGNNIYYCCARMFALQGFHVQTATSGTITYVPWYATDRSSPVDVILLIFQVFFSEVDLPV